MTSKQPANNVQLPCSALAWDSAWAKKCPSPPERIKIYDFIASWIVGGERHIATVQLKEVVPAQANPQASIHAIVASLTKYTNSDGLTVAIHLNREGRFDPCLLQVPKLKMGSLWVFGSANPDQSRWNLWGNFKESDAYATQFLYPEAHPVERSGD